MKAVRSDGGPSLTQHDVPTPTQRVGMGSTGIAFSSAASIFGGAFLLFLVQPMIGKTILPWFGGTPAVWTTCMVFFQVLLLVGYAYAALLTKLRNPLRQAALHLVLLVIALMLLPITPGPHWKPTDGDFATLRILQMVTVCVGGPYFLLSATSPLIQTWFARAYPGRIPYRLYALSNIGSLGALLIYPVIVEPIFTTSQQGWLWSALFVFFVLVNLLLGWQLWRSRDRLLASGTTANSNAQPEHTQGKSPSVPKTKPNWSDRVAWLLLPALATMMLLAITNHLTQDVAVVPFLWIVPLSLYLISLIICFDRDQWYARSWFSLGAMISIFIACDLIFLAYLGPSISVGPLSFWNQVRREIRVIVVVYLAILFFLCLVCHGEVVRRRPDSNRLTEFYLTISAGGALGGMFVALVCPLVFSSLIELKAGLLIGFLVSLGVFLTDGRRRWFTYLTMLSKVGGAMLLVITSAAVFGAQWLSLETDAAMQLRSFYGVLTVREFPNLGQALYHGMTLHGFQSTNESNLREPTTYYVADSGVGRALNSIPRDHSIHVGVVGLGVGTLAVYGKPGDRFRFYEINSQVVELARRPFRFLELSEAQTEIVLGDARLSLERESPQGFDVLVLDAFSGDAIPVHLLTREALALYLHHLKPNGIIAIHVSNRYLDLEPVVAKLAADAKLPCALISVDDGIFLERSPSDWILISREQAMLDLAGIREHSQNLPLVKNVSVWTDQYNNLFEILR